MKKQSNSLNNVLANIEAARNYKNNNDSMRIVAVVSGSESGQVTWQKRLEEVSPCIFNADNSSLILSLQEKTGKKTKEGNFLGTLLAYKRIKELSKEKNVKYADAVTLMGMIFGKGARLSPITQSKGCRKPAVEVTPSHFEICKCASAFTALEQALFYFVPVAKYLEKRGFKGVLNKWGDETQIPSVDLTKQSQLGNEYEGVDVIKMYSVLKVTEENARHKEWIAYSEIGNLLVELPRDNKKNIIKKLKEFGVKPDDDDKYFAGVSMGPVAVSYDFLEIANKVFAEEIGKEGVFIDFDPYIIMALAMDKTDYSFWEETIKKHKDLKSLLNMVPDFFEKVQSIKDIFKERFKRDLKIKAFDLGEDSYWADIGTHVSMRRKYLSLLSEKPDGRVGRKIAGITEGKDKNGNIIVNSKVASSVEIKNSIIINSEIYGTGNINESVVTDSTMGPCEVVRSFVVKSCRTGKTVLDKHSGLFESFGSEDLFLEEGMRHVSIFSAEGKIDLKVSETTNLRDTENTYNVPIYGNSISFKEVYEEMFGVSSDEIEKRRKKVTNQLEKIKEKERKFIVLKFGTSGLRDRVENMTDMECYINARGFVKFLKDPEVKEIDSSGEIAVGGDLRKSTPRIIKAVLKAIEDEGLTPEFSGFVPSPVLALYGINKGVPSIMVTGSHIPDDRNGIKFTKTSGEVLKTDEAKILSNVKKARDEEYVKTNNESLFDDKGMFKNSDIFQDMKVETEPVEDYIKRYLDVFGGEALKDKKIVLYQHSAVGRDIIKDIFEGLGAEVIVYGRSEEFVPVDTEKVSEKTRELLKKLSEEYKPFAIISTDGDSDRPLVADEKGEFIPGDKLGALVAFFLKPDFIAIPISANDAVVKALKESNIEVKQTRIGSPYVIAAMNAKLKENPNAKVVSWESNGGFLLGSNWTVNGKEMKALPTRDAVTPILSALLLASNENLTISDMVKQKLPLRYTHADVVDNHTLGCENYTAEMGKTIVKNFSPENKEISQVDYEDGKIKVYYENDEIKEAGEELLGELINIKGNIENFFNKEKGFDKIVSINFLDGIRIVFGNGDVSHLRPSGNAPEFRNYATSDMLERAEEIVEMRKVIVPEIVKSLVAG